MGDPGAGSPLASTRPLRFVHGRTERLILRGLHDRQSASVGRWDGSGGRGLREPLARQRTWYGRPLWIRVQKHGEEVAVQYTRRHQGGCLRRSGIVLPRRGAPPSDFPTVLLLLPLLLLPLLLLPLLLRPSLLRSILPMALPRLWLLRLSLPRPVPLGLKFGAAISPS